ncbi:MAG: ABC transporter substrate-binding protein [Christensenellales bacterium]
MKKITMFLCLAFVLTTLGASGITETFDLYGESPILTKLVEAGDLPPVEERLPENPKLTDEISPEYLDYEIGTYGGTLKHVTDDINWDADVFIACNEALFTCQSVISDTFTPNLLEAVEINDDNTEFIFTLRKGLKWSDGTEVTIEDFRFTFEDFIFNTAINPVVSAKMRSGGSSSGAPLSYEIIDDQHFAIRFDEPYGGFLVAISIGGWVGYTDYLKPAAYLKPFHLDYAAEIHGSEEAYFEFIRPYAAIMGYDDPTAEDVWTYVFHRLDVQNWEITDSTDVLANEYFKDAGHETNMPMLYAWIMSSTDGTITTWTRNPYYHKIDSAGNQLPYIDYLTSLLVQDGEMVQMAYMSGDANFGQGVTMIDNISLYRENAANSGNTAYIAKNHTNPTSFYININYGLNTDGSVKDDELSQAWQEVVTKTEFRRALTISIDVDEIIDSVFKGFAEPNPWYDCSHDIEGANAILDEMGMMDVDGDGFRETPSGLKLAWFIYTDAAATDQIPMCELLSEFWQEIGLNCNVQTLDNRLLSTKQAANEITMRVSWYSSTQNWHYLDFAQFEWAPLYDAWVKAGGMTAEDPSSIAAGIEPPEEIKEIRQLIQSLMSVLPDTAVNEVLPSVMDRISSEYLLVEPIINAMQSVVIDSDIGNVPTGGNGISWSFSREQMFYRSFTYND